MSKKNVLVTGAYGFIGKALINRLDRRQYHVFALDSQSGQDLHDERVEKFYLQDITSPFKIDQSFDCVIHLAALNITHVGKAEYSHYHDVNVVGTENLIKAVHTKRFVLMSTVKVYQAQEAIIDEQSPVDPQDDYARSKIKAEEICHRYFDDHDLTVLRSVNVVGPGQAAKAVIPVFFHKALHNEPLEIIYSKDSFLQMLDVQDLVNAFYLLLNKEHAHGVINLCPEETITLGKLAQEVITLCRSDSAIRFLSDKQASKIRYGSKRAYDQLNWQAQTSFKNILKKYYDHISICQ